MFVSLQLDVAMAPVVSCSQTICRRYSCPSSCIRRRTWTEFAGLCGWPSQQEVPTFYLHTQPSGETCNQRNKKGLQFHLALQVNRKRIHWKFRCCEIRLFPLASSCKLIGRVSILNVFTINITVITSNDHSFGCPIIYTDISHNTILYIDTSTILDTIKLSL